VERPEGRYRRARKNTGSYSRLAIGIGSRRGGRSRAYDGKSFADIAGIRSHDVVNHRGMRILPASWSEEQSEESRARSVANPRKDERRYEQARAFNRSSTFSFVSTKLANNVDRGASSRTREPRSRDIARRGKGKERKFRNAERGTTAES